MDPIVTVIVVPVVLALSGALATYLNNLRIAQRKDTLDRINRQLAELYGPLMALVETGRITFGEFRKNYGPDVATAYFDADLTAVERAAWREYVRLVFQPANERMYELIASKADLLRESTVPDCLLQLGAHIQTYKVTIARWDEGDFSSHLALVDFPPEVNDYARQSFSEIKNEQHKLLRKAGKRWRLHKATT